MFAAAKHRRQINRLLEKWVEFRDAVSRPSTGETPQARDRKMLGIKAGIAEYLTLPTDSIPGNLGQEAAMNQKHMLDLLNRFQGAPADDSPRDLTNFERDWQRSYLFLNQLKGADLTPKRKSFKAPVAPPTPGIRRNWLAAFFNFWLIKFASIIAILVGALWALAHILPWERMGVTSPGSANLGGLRDAAGNVVSQVGQADNFAGSMANKLQSFFGPVIAQYGTEVTILMVTVLGLAVGYLFFIRLR